MPRIRFGGNFPVQECNTPRGPKCLPKRNWSQSLRKVLTIRIVSRPLALTPRSCGGDGLSDHPLQYLLVDIGKLLDVKTAFAGGVLAESGEQSLGPAEPGYIVENGCGFARRESDERHVTLAAALVDVVVNAEADDRRPEHFRLFACRLLHQFDQHLGIRALRFVREPIDECGHTGVCRFGLVFYHPACLPSSICVNLLYQSRSPSWTDPGRGFLTACGPASGYS